MYEDPQDMFREMDEFFTHLYTWMIRDFAAGDPNASGYYRIIRHSGQSPTIPGSQREKPSTDSEPVVEIHRIGDEVKVITELPGTTLDAVQIRLPGSTLTIDADEDHLQYHAGAI